MALQIIINMEKLWKATKNKSKQRIVNVHFQLPHGRETWTLNKNMEKRINAF